LPLANWGGAAPSPLVLNIAPAPEFEFIHIVAGEVQTLLTSQLIQFYIQGILEFAEHCVILWQREPEVGMVVTQQGFRRLLTCME
jgi:hypothetical protein